jgi:hypothetical protein
MSARHTLMSAMLDDVQLDAVVGCGLFSRVASVALIGIGYLHMVSGNLLHSGGEPFNLRSVLFVGSGDMQRQHMSQGIHCPMHLGPFAALVVSGSRSRFRCGLDRATVKNHRVGNG